MKKIMGLIGLLLHSWVWSQNFTLQVQVTENNAAVSGASVKIIETGQSRITDKKGTAVFNVPEGTYHIVAEKNGKYAETRVKVNKNLRIKIKLRKKTEQLGEVIITATRAGEEMPFTHQIITKKDIAEKYVTQDIPYVLSNLPSVVTTSDAGHGVGYTGIRIRGISPQQINVTLNGIPLNDPESHSVYWVDIPDFVSSTENIQVQRGVGTSTYGTGAFGANINLLPEKPADSAYFGLSTAAGSFNTYKITAKANTGRVGKYFAFNMRASKLHSDGYIDRAFADMQSYFFSGLFRKGKHRIQLLHFGGHERTYQAWYGVDKETFEKNPRFNYAGAIYDDAWNIIDFYDNEVDDYTQKHYQLHYHFNSRESWAFGVSAFYVKGYGFYEQYKQNQSFDKYGFHPLVIGTHVIDHTDLIRRKWLDNDFYGMVANARLTTDHTTWLFGLGANRYAGWHYGEVIWARFADDSEIRHQYYRNLGDKRSINGFIKNTYSLADNLKLYTDIQLRSIDYQIDYDPQVTYDPDEKINLTDRLFFVNPKAGLTYEINPDQTAYISIAQTHREPNRTDYIENVHKPKPETLNDLEAGYRLQKKNLQWHTNVYYMHYKDQLVYSGRIDEVGNPIRENVGKSYRAGWENQVNYRYGKWEWAGHLTLSRNKNIDYQAWDGTQMKNFGHTDISYSPSVVAGFQLKYQVAEPLAVLFRTKYVGKQYMDNRNIPESILPAYAVSGLDILFSPQINPAKKFDIHLKINNLFNKKYASNGYMWGDTAYYFPQAGRHFYLGMNIIL